MSKRKSSQPSVADIFAKKVALTEKESDDDDNNITSDVTQSKQHILIDLNVEQAKCENGIDWIVSCLFDIHFTGTSLHEVELESEVESVAAGGSAPTSIPKTKTQSQLQPSASAGSFSSVIYRKSNAI